MSELATVKDKVTQDCIKKMQDARAKEDAEALLEAVKGGSELKTAAEKSSREIAGTGFFTREGAVPSGFTACRKEPADL